MLDRYRGTHQIEPRRGSRCTQELVSFGLLAVLPIQACAIAQSRDQDYPCRTETTPTVAPIPEFKLDLTCGLQEEPDPYRLTAEEQKELVDFAAFMEEKQGSVVYVDVAIDQQCAACGCPRAEPDVNHAEAEMQSEGDSAATGHMYIDTSSPMDRKEGFAGTGWGGAKMFLEGISLDVSVPNASAVHLEIYLPRWEHLVESQYNAGEYGTFAKFDGLFTARYHDRTGVNMLHLDVLHPSDKQIEQLRLIREQRSSEEHASEAESSE